MNAARELPAGARPRWPWFAAGALALLAAAAAVAAWRWPRPVPPPVAVQDADPRLSYPTPYRNVRPDVRYVGDQACAECHPSVCDSYHRHPMGRSLGPAVGPSQPGGAAEPRPACFDTLGFHYAAERRGDRLFHRETVPAPAGDVGDSVEAEVRFVLGSGTRGESYLVVENGCVFQSPISWYRQKGMWDLAPGYCRRNEHFDRPVIPECLFCHCNRVEPVANSINRYHEPLFRGEAIGCERCHGPGELHVRRRRAGEAAPGDRDTTIVNPADLEPPLREAVCEQCHLQGQVRVRRRGRDVFDYRPGLPLSAFWAVFELAEEEGGSRKAVGQVEQMHQSRCFRASGGALGCSSCHDPHRQPPEAAKAAYYAARCMTCHRDRGCSLPAAARRRKGDDCTACHMPRLSTADVVHVAATDHRILRRPDPEEPAARGRPPALARLVPFHRGYARATPTRIATEAWPWQTWRETPRRGRCGPTWPPGPCPCWQRPLGIGPTT